MFRWLQRRRIRRLNAEVERYEQEHACVECGHQEWMHVDECCAMTFVGDGVWSPCPCMRYLQPIRMSSVRG